MINVIINIVTIILFIYLLYLTYKSPVEKMIKLYFFLFVFLTLTWGASRFILLLIHRESQNAASAINIPIAAALLATFFLFLYVRELLSVKFFGYYRFGVFALLISNCLMAVLGIFGLTIERALIVGNNIEIKEYSSIYLLTIILMLVNITLSISLLIQKWRKDKNNNTRKNIITVMLAILFGMVTVFLLSVVPDLLYENYENVFTVAEFPFLLIPLAILLTGIYRNSFLNIKLNVLKIHTVKFLIAIFAFIFMLFVFTTISSIGTSTNELFLKDCLLVISVLYLTFRVICKLLYRQTKYTLNEQGSRIANDIIVKNLDPEYFLNELALHLSTNLSLSYVKIDTNLGGAVAGQVQMSPHRLGLKHNSEHSFNSFTGNDNVYVRLLIGPKSSLLPYFTRDRKKLKGIAETVYVRVKEVTAEDEHKKRLEKEVARATRELDKAVKTLRLVDKNKNEFISMASHQLRTPLSIIRNYESLLNSGAFGGVSTRQKEALKSINQSTSQMVAMVDQLLDAARITNGTFKIEQRDTNIDDLVKNELSRFKYTAKQKGIELKLSCEADEVSVLCDRQKIIEVLNNFISNAIQYSESNSVIRVLTKHKDNFVSVKVVDEGVGISKKDQKNLFKKFSRGEGAQKMRPDGTGLGLFVAKKIIEAHKGRVIFSSVFGKGSTFGFTIPKQ